MSLKNLPTNWLISVTAEQMRYRTANTSDESRFDIKVKAFWRRGQTAFFHVRVTHVNSRSNTLLLLLLLLFLYFKSVYTSHIL